MSLCLRLLFFILLTRCVSTKYPPPNFRGGVFIYPYCAVKPIISLICYHKIRNLFWNAQKKERRNRNLSTLNSPLSTLHSEGGQGATLLGVTGGYWGLLGVTGGYWGRWKFLPLVLLVSLVSFVPSNSQLSSLHSQLSTLYLYIGMGEYRKKRQLFADFLPRVFYFS